MSDQELEAQPALNTDKELWRKVPGDAYAPSIHVTQGGGIGINVAGSVYVKPVEEWHRLAGGKLPGLVEIDKREARMREKATTVCNLHPAIYIGQPCDNCERITQALLEVAREGDEEITQANGEIRELETSRCESCIKAERAQIMCVQCQGDFTNYDELCHICAERLKKELTQARVALAEVEADREWLRERNENNVTLYTLALAQARDEIQHWKNNHEGANKKKQAVSTLLSGACKTIAELRAEIDRLKSENAALLAVVKG